MKLSNALFQTQKEDPKDAETISHKLLLRGGFIKKISAGIYSYLPLALRVLRKIELIIREEMDKKGAQELLLPTVTPAELWKRSGRWDKYGKELLRFTDRHDVDYCYGPTHEEPITDLVGNMVNSYKELPLLLYQIQSKFRDEIRPRFGLMRSREFVMKDAYSFHADTACLDRTYDQMMAAYRSIFNRCGISFEAVQADSGAIGGNQSSEFMVLAQSGEDLVLRCTHCKTAVNVEAAKLIKPTAQKQDNSPGLEKVHTPHQNTIKELTNGLSVSADQNIKSLAFEWESSVILVLIRGDYELNEIKLEKQLGHPLKQASEATLNKAGLVAGYMGPIGVNASVQVLADYSILTQPHFIVGANEPHHHYRHAVLERDFKVTAFYDLRNAMAADRCAYCEQGNYEALRGIEVGHVFKLGEIYSKAMNAQFKTESGTDQSFIMGCYGIGVGRTLAAVIEQCHDEHGMIWPRSIAPYTVHLICTNTKDETLLNTADQLYQQLQQEDIEVLYDNRACSAGVKFKDADLIGCPIQLVIGRAYTERKAIEVKYRKNQEKTEVGIDQIINTIKEG